jgi:hypothetical protein
MVSATNGWAVGNYGVILRWNGSTWSSISSPTTRNLHTVHMVSASSGWAVGGDYFGGSGIILRWNGSSWSVVPLPTTPELLDVWMLSALDGWAVGYNGTLLHWNGSNWTAAASPSADTYTSVAMFTTNDGWAVGDRTLRYAPTAEPVISHLEVSQATQTITDGAPLIAGKPAVVRAYLSCNLVACWLPDLTGALQVSSPAGTRLLSPIGGRVAAAHIANWETQRGLPERTVNFLVPGDLLTATVNFSVTVGGTTTVRSFTFNPSRSLRLAWVAMPYMPAQPAPPPGAPPVVHRPDTSVIETGVSDLLAMYPVAPDDVVYVPQPGFDGQMIAPFECASGEECPADWLYLASLNLLWERVSREGRWTDGIVPDRLYGWVPTEARAGGLCGIADAIWANPEQRLGRVAAGVANLICGPGTLAHELGHLLDEQGLRHTNNRDRSEDPHCVSVPRGPAPDYPPYPGLPLGTIGEWGVRVGNGRFDVLDPRSTYDFMSYCSPEWVSLHNYTRLHQGFAPVANAMAETPATPTRQFLASGVVHRSPLTATLEPLFTLTSTVAPHPDRGGPYCLELRDSLEALLDRRCFDLTFTSVQASGPMAAQAFTSVLPFPDGTQAVVLTHNGTELARRAASSGAPQVQIVTPNGGEVWPASGAHTVTWTASDPDGDGLHFAVSYSPDNGQTWYPVVLDTTANQVVIDAGNLPGSADGLVRIEATDGFHTTSDVSDAAFTVVEKSPRVVIMLPADNTSLPPRVPHFLQGYAYDLENGTLRGSTLQWTSSRDGVLGSGPTITAMLSPGQHTLTLIAMDGDGQTGTRSVEVYVGYRLFHPTILR